VPELILASSSPRRIELLNQLNLEFRVVLPGTDETLNAGESHLDYVTRMSTEKAETVFADEAQNGDHIVLSGDTVVIIDGELLGKPVNENHAVEMLQRLSGNTHRVITSVSVAGKKGVNFHDAEDQSDTISLETILVETNVQFHVLTPEECESYWRTGEPADKAGGYAIQGLGAVFVKRIEGSYSNVVGLPLIQTAQLLSHFGIECSKRQELETEFVKDIVQHG